MLLTSLMTLFVSVCFADTYLINDICYDLDSGSRTASVAPRTDSEGRSVYAGDIVIPETIEHDGITYTVTSIGAGAFDNSHNLLSVIIPNTVTSIGYSAFHYCYNLASPILPESLTYIGESAFESCESITKMDIPDHVTYIGKQAFLDCSISELTLGSSVQTIVEFAFDSNKITSIVFPPSVETIGQHAFSSNDLRSVTFNDSPTDIESAAFSDNPNLSHVDLGNNVKSVDGFAFQGAYALESIYFPNSVKYIAGYVCNLCWNLKTVVIGNQAYRDPDTEGAVIEERAFDGLPNLTSLTLSNSVESIKELAFSGIGIEQLTIPRSMKSIGKDAFYRCKNLTTLTIDDAAVELLDGAFSECTGLKNVDLGNAVTLVDGFRDCTSLTSITIPASAKIVGGTTGFTNCTALTSVTLSPGVERLDMSAFEGCTSLKTLEIPTTVTLIGERALARCAFASFTLPNSVIQVSPRAFEDNNELETVTLPNSLDRIEEQALHHCTNLNDITLPASVKTIGVRAFQGCESLSAINITDGVETIQDFAFQYCGNLESVTIGRSVKQISSSALSDCRPFLYYGAITSGKLTNITVDAANENYCSVDNALFNKDKTHLLLVGQRDTYTVPSTVRSVGPMAFASTEIKHVTLPSSVESLGDSLFIFCCELEEIAIPDAVKQIPDYAFRYCTSLSHVQFGNGITKIGNTAFGACSAVRTFDLPETLKVIGESAFAGCGFTSIVIPASVTDIAEDAFNYCTWLRSVTNLATEPQNISGKSVFYEDADITVYVPEESVALYRYSGEGTSGWYRYNIVGINPTSVTPHAEAPATHTDCYNIIGQRLSNTPHSLYIRNGKKFYKTGRTL